MQLQVLCGVLFTVENAIQYYIKSFNYFRTWSTDLLHNVGTQNSTYKLHKVYLGIASCININVRFVVF